MLYVKEFLLGRILFPMAPPPPRLLLNAFSSLQMCLRVRACTCIFPARVHGTDRHSGIRNVIGRLCWYYLLPWGTGLEGGMVIFKKQSTRLLLLFCGSASFWRAQLLQFILGVSNSNAYGGRKETSMSEGEGILERQQGRVGTVVDCHMHALPTGRSHFSAVT